jgi:hypothetical protein
MAYGSRDWKGIMPHEEVVVMVVNNKFIRIPTSTEGKEQDTENIGPYPSREYEHAFTCVPTC